MAGASSEHWSMGSMCRRSGCAKIPDSSWKTVRRTYWTSYLTPTSTWDSSWANMRRTRDSHSSVRTSTLKSTSIALWRNPNGPSGSSRRGRRGCTRSSHRTGKSLRGSIYLCFFCLFFFFYIMEAFEVTVEGNREAGLTFSWKSTFKAIKILIWHKFHTSLLYTAAALSLYFVQVPGSETVCRFFLSVAGWRLFTCLRPLTKI